MITSEQTKRDFAFWKWYVLSFIVMAVLNILPFFPARKNFEFDAWATAGVPFEYHWFGGTGGTHSFYLWWFLADIVFALGVAYLTAWILRHGWRDAFHRFQNWGLEKKISLELMPVSFNISTLAG